MAFAVQPACHQMNRLSAILPVSQVLVDVDATSKKRVFEAAGLLFENLHAIARATVTDNLFARERLGSTGLGHGVAIPHGRIKGLKHPLAAVIRLSYPIPFDAPDDEPVNLLIFLLVPEAATQKHLEILSEIAELLSDAPLRETKEFHVVIRQPFGLRRRCQRGKRHLAPAARHRKVGRQAVEMIEDTMLHQIEHDGLISRFPSPNPNI